MDDSWQFVKVSLDSNMHPSDHDEKTRIAFDLYQVQFELFTFLDCPF